MMGLQSTISNAIVMLSSLPKTQERDELIEELVQEYNSVAQIVNELNEKVG